MVTRLRGVRDYYHIRKICYPLRDQNDPECYQKLSYNTVYILYRHELYIVVSSQ